MRTVSRASAGSDLLLIVHFDYLICCGTVTLVWVLKNIALKRYLS